MPRKNHSWRAASSANAVPGAPPNCTAAETTPRGGLGARLGSLACKYAITAAHTGAAPLLPLASCIAAPLALPTHTPTV